MVINTHWTSKRDQQYDCRPNSAYLPVSTLYLCLTQDFALRSRKNITSGVDGISDYFSVLPLSLTDCAGKFGLTTSLLPKNALPVIPEKDRDNVSQAALAIVNHGMWATTTMDHGLNEAVKQALNANNGSSGDLTATTSVMTTYDDPPSASSSTMVKFSKKRKKSSVAVGHSSKKSHKSTTRNVHSIGNRTMNSKTTLELWQSRFRDDA